MRKICLVTSTRADYGIMSSMIKKLSHIENLYFRLCVTGTHLSEKYGYTKKFIDVEDKYIDCIDILENSNSTFAVCASIITKFSSYFLVNNFDLVILLGDRYEIFEIASVAYMCRTKIAHIHGGEVSYGALDDGFRHCISKLADIHFPSCERYKNRLIQMGESPNTIYNVGSLSVENILNMKFLDKKTLSQKYGYDLKKYAMITFNPVTKKEDSGFSEYNELIKAMSEFEYELIIIYPNIDEGSNIIINALKKLSFGNFHIVKSLPYEDYLSLSKNCDLFIGNSSAGIIEIPSLHVPIINVGDRQLGREVAPSVICCKAIKKDIIDSIKYSNSDEYRKILENTTNIYQKNGVSDNIIKEIIDFINGEHPLKKFCDII